MSVNTLTAKETLALHFQHKATTRNRPPKAEQIKVGQTRRRIEELEERRAIRRAHAEVWDV